MTNRQISHNHDNAIITGYCTYLHTCYVCWGNVHRQGIHFQSRCATQSSVVHNRTLDNCGRPCSRITNWGHDVISTTSDKSLNQSRQWKLQMTYTGACVKHNSYNIAIFRLMIIIIKQRCVNVWLYLFKSLSGKVGAGYLTFDPGGLSLVGRERLEQLYGHAKVVVTQTPVGRAYLLQEAHQRNCGEREREREDRVTAKQSTIMKLLN